MQTTENSSSESYDLITETAQFLEALEREIDPTNIDTAIQVFVTMAEYCQGNNNTHPDSLSAPHSPLPLHQVLAVKTS